MSRSRSRTQSKARKEHASVDPSLLSMKILHKQLEMTLRLMNKLPYSAQEAGFTEAPRILDKFNQAFQDYGSNLAEILNSTLVEESAKY